MRKSIVDIVSQSIDLKRAILADEALLNAVEKIVQLCVQTFRNGGKILFCGNGGSAADAQHLAAEFSGRFLIDRAPLFAEALHVNSSFLTAVANDFGYDEVFARGVEAKAKSGDVVFGLSTSGNSKNIIKAIETAKENNIQTVGITGSTGGRLANICDHLLRVPSEHTPRIQEAHILLGHIICQLVEEEIFKS